MRDIKILQRVVSKKIKDFLFSNKFREILFFLFFVFIASVFWLLNTLNYEHESEVDILVEGRNLPENIVMVSENPQRVRVKIKDKGIKLLNYMFRIDGNRVNIDMSGKLPASGAITFKAENLIRENSLFSQETSIISCSPDSVRINYAGAEALKIPVVLDSDIKADRFHFVKSVTVLPDSVLVYVPENMTESFEYIQTVRLEGPELSDSASFVVGLKNADRIKTVPEKVEVIYQVGVYTDYSLNVPITAVNFPEGYKLRTFPSFVKVMFQIGVDDIKYISADDFSIVLDYNELKDLGSDEAAVNVVSSPLNVRYLHTEPQKVEFLIERNL